MAIRKSITTCLRSSTCRIALLTFTSLLVLICLSVLTISTPSTLELLASDDVPLDGHQVCQACLDGAASEWSNCVQNEAGGDVGDADCRSKYNSAVASCQVTYCNQMAEAFHSAPDGLELLTPTVSAVTVADFCSDCNQQCLYEAVQIQDQCMANGTDASTCNNQFTQYYNNCLTLFCNSMGCAIKKLPTTKPGGN